MLLKSILNIFHLILLFLPILVFIIPMTYVIPWYKYYVLIALLTPLHWKFLNDECISTVITKKMGDFSNTRTTSAFSETYLKWLYFPVMKNIFKLKWNNDGISKMVYIHWIFNFILIWYFTFYVFKI